MTLKLNVNFQYERPVVCKGVESFRFVVTKGEAAKVRARCKALNLTLSEYLRSVAIPKDTGEGSDGAN
jgi:hypothetical protein